MECRARVVTSRLYVNGVGLSGGGGATHLESFLPALSSARPEWNIVVYLSSATRAAGVASVPGIRTVVVPHSRRRRSTWDTFGVGREALAGGADALLNLANYGPLRPPVPSVLYQRNSLYFDRGWLGGRGGSERAEALIRRELAFQSMRCSRSVIVPSRAMERYLCAWRRFPRRAHVEVVPHGIDLSRFAFAPRKGSGRARLVTLGDPYLHKDQLLLLEMMDVLVHRGVDAHLDVTIQEDDRSPVAVTLRERIESGALKSRVTLVGRVDPAAFLRGADLLVASSRTESFGFPVLEAMGAGTAVVASSIPAFRELLGGGGFYFPPGDARAAADAVMSVLSEGPAGREARRAEARARAERFTWEANAERVARILESAAGQ